MQHLEDSFSLNAEIQAQVAALIASCGEFQHLTRARLVVVLSQRAVVERARNVPVAVLQGACYEGVGQASRGFNAWLRAAFVAEVCDWSDADFLLLVDAALWPTTEIDRAHVLYHALSHIEQRLDAYGAPKFGDEGQPLLRMRPHDIERFAGELERFGSVVPELRSEYRSYEHATQQERGALRAVK